MARVARKKDEPIPDVAEHPAEARGIGDNRAPLVASLDLTSEQWTELLDQDFDEAIKRRDDLIASFKRFETGFPLRRSTEPGEPPIGWDKWSDDIQGRAGDLRDKLLAIDKMAGALHTLRKAPVLTASKAIDGYKRMFLQPIDDALLEIRKRQTLYAQHVDYLSREAAKEEAEAKRKDAEAIAATAAQTLEPKHLDQAAQAFGEAAEAQAFAQAKPAEHTRTFGDTGSVTSLRDNWSLIIEESDLLTLAKAVVAGTVPVSYLAFNETRIRVAIRTEKVREIPGCVIRNEAVAR